MKELISIGIGGCGINIMDEYLSKINLEFSQAEGNRETFFDEVCSNYIPRFVAIDNDPRSIDRLIVGKNSFSYKPENLIFGHSSAKNVFNIGQSGLPIDEVEKIIRKEIEKCDNLLGFTIFASTEGGTGSGFTSKLLHNLAEYYPEKLINCQMNYLNYEKNSYTNLLSIYNTVLLSYDLTELPNSVLCSNNFSLFNITQNYALSKDFSLQNQILADLNFNINAGTVFNGLQPCSIRKMLVNLILYPRKHFFTANLYKEFSFCYNNNFLNKSVFQLNDNLNGTISCESINQLSFESMFCLTQGNFFSSEIETFNLSGLNKSFILKQYGRGIGHCLSGKKYREITYISGSNLVMNLFKSILELFSLGFRRKSYLWIYTNEGADEMDFVEKESNLCDLISEYNYENNYEIDAEDE